MVRCAEGERLVAVAYADVDATESTYRAAATTIKAAAEALLAHRATHGGE